MGCFDREPRKAGPLIDLGLRPGTFSSPEQIFSLFICELFHRRFWTLTLWMILPSLVCAQSCSPPWPWQVAISTWWERLSAIQGLRKIVKKLRKAAENQKRRKINNKLRKIADTEKDDTQYERVRLGRHLLMSLWERSGHLGAIVFSTQLVPSHHKLMF